MNLTWTHWWSSILSRLQKLEPDETPPEKEPISGSEPVDEEDRNIEPPGVINVGAWTGKSSLNNPQRDVKFCVANNINRLDVIVNDHSAWREPSNFTTHDIGKIIRLCTMAQAAGIETHLMSWVMPHERYIDQAAEQLLPLAKAAGVKSIQWDAEEPWTRARAAMSYPAAAKRLADAFAQRTCEMGVNGIGYTPAEKFGPLAEVCDYMVPQCYSTKSSGIKPEDVVPKLYRRFRERFGDKRQLIGLAAYRQSGIPGHSVETAMRTALAGAQAIEGIDTVIYWSLGHIRRSSRIAKVVRSIRAPAAAVA